MKVPFVDLTVNYAAIKGKVDNAVSGVLSSGRYILGEQLRLFEENYAAFCSTKYAIGTSNGTAALHLALLASGLEQGDEVITVPNTFIATTESITHAGCKPVFVDVDVGTGLMDLELVEDVITKKTKAIVPVHLYGQMCDMARLRKIVSDNDLILIEDACQAHGAYYDGNKPGHYSDAAVFSFFPAKNLGCYGDGGAVVTNNGEIARIVKKLRNHGRSFKHLHEREGYNYRLDELQAAVLNVKLRYLKDWNNKRRTLARAYSDLLSELVVVPSVQSKMWCNFHLYVIQVERRSRWYDYFDKYDIGYGTHYPIPLHLQPCYEYLGYEHGDFPVAENRAARIASLPMYPEMTYDMLNYVVSTIRKIKKVVK